MRRPKAGRKRGPRVRTPVNEGRLNLRGERGQKSDERRPGRARILARDISTRLSDPGHGGGRSMRSGR